MGGGEGLRILPGNEKIWEVLHIGSNQWRCSFGGPYGLDMTAIIMIAEDLGVIRDINFYNKATVFEREGLRILNKKSKTDDESCNSHKKEECKILYGDHFEWACRNCEEMKRVRTGNQTKNNN
jgi:hypothetical protein